MSANRPAPPPRGTRPPNRRELLRLAAADLFAAGGYANVSMADVAAAVNMSPSSVYKHYSGKVDLLFEALDAALDDTVAHLPARGTAGLERVGRALASGTLDNRSAGVLLQREARHLPADARSLIRRKRGHIRRAIAAEVRRSRPDLDAGHANLLALCAIAVVSSVSFHHLEIPRPRYDELLGDLAASVLAMKVPACTGYEVSRVRERPRRRIDEIFDAAIALFAERGYAAVGIEDIGAAVGIAGPSLYNHIESKRAILLGAMLRGHEQLRAVMRAAEADGGDPSGVLRRLTDGYVDLAFDQPNLISVLLTEFVHLREEAGARQVRTLQRDYIADWVALSRAHRPGVDPVVTRIKVQAAQMLANDIARTPAPRRVPGLREIVRDAAWLVQQ